jgi:F-type H+-transporting ATPase subunit gamma
MPSLKDIQKRISSVEGTKQITRTMEMVATAKIRHATERIVQATPYSEAMVEVLDSISQHSSHPDSPLLQMHDEVKRVVLVVVASDRGMAGGFNSNVLRAADKFIEQKKQEGIACDVIACGKTVIAYFKYRKQPMVLEFRDQSSDPQMSEAREIASYLINEYTKDELPADQAVLFYNHAKNVADQIMRTENILPVENIAYHTEFEEEGKVKYDDESAKTASANVVGKVDGAREEAGELLSDETQRGSFDYEPSAEEVLDVLLPSYVETRIYHALLDSAAGEQGARRKAMKAATDNATDMITTLNRVYNRVRQGAITTEITEIVGGAAALEDE